MHRTLFHLLSSSSASKMLILSESQVRQCLTMKECLDVNRAALMALSNGKAHVPTRLGLPYQPPVVVAIPPKVPLPTTLSAAVGAAPSAPDAEDWTLFKPALYNPFVTAAAAAATTTEEGQDERNLDGQNHHDHSHSHAHSHDHEDHDALPTTSENEQTTTNTDLATDPTAVDSNVSNDNDDNNKINNNNIDQQDQQMLMGMKVVSIRANNPSKFHLPLVPATIVNLNAETGLVNGIVAATYLTAARTAAGSAIATRLVKQAHAHMAAAAAQAAAANSSTSSSTAQLLNNNNNIQPLPIQHMVVFGAGLQAELHIHMITTAMEQPTLPKLTIINRTRKRAELLKDHVLQHNLSEHVDVLLLNGDKGGSGGASDYSCASLDVTEAISRADVICTTTNTMTPLFDGNMLQPGCHVNGVGSYTPDMQEVSAKFVANRAKVLVDTMEARSVGDLRGIAEQYHPVLLLGKVLQQEQQSSSLQQHQLLVDWLQDPRTSFLDCTFYKAVGTAIQDVMTANLVVQKARELGIGTLVDMEQ